MASLGIPGDVIADLKAFAHHLSPASIDKTSLLNCPSSRDVVPAASFCDHPRLKPIIMTARASPARHPNS
jgi:hypothetical protein